MTLAEMERRATLLGRVQPDELEWLKKYESRRWNTRLQEMSREGALLAAGEGPYYLETRQPFKQTADFATVTLAATSKNILPQTGTGFMFPAAYFDLGKEIRFTLMGKATTGATPGNLTIELRYQAAQPLTDAGGTILATSSAIAMGASKTNISWKIVGRVHARAGISTAAGLFGWMEFTSNQLSLLIPAANNPLIIPESAPAAVNVDTTLAGGISVQWKRSGSTAETVTVSDLSVESVT